MSVEQLKGLIEDFSPEKLGGIIRSKSRHYRPALEDMRRYLDKDEWGSILEISKLGQIEYDEVTRLVVVAIKSSSHLAEKWGRKQQYELGKAILKGEQYDAGLFVFYDDIGRFRFSLINARYRGKKRDFTNPRRYTYFVVKNLPNKNFLTQISKADFSSLEKLLESFSIATVSDEFYKRFKTHYEPLADAVTGSGDGTLKKDFALLFAIRIIFLGFVQKKGWIGNKDRFIQDYWAAYQETSTGKEKFYSDWLKPLFFEALNSAVGHKVKYRNNDFPDAIERTLQEAPFLNGELFKEKPGVDNKGLGIPDAAIGKFLDFLFEYNFTIEENTLYDEELELNPEFLGIIFERLVNKDMGAVYTPRVEVDMMCRLALVKWLEKNVQWDEPRRSLGRDDLYELFFREGGKGEEHDPIQRDGNFSTGEIKRVIEKLETVTVCDPAAGSGAFLVGMLQVVDEVLENLYDRPAASGEIKTSKPEPYERKKAIIGRSLYGVDVMRWAVWINQLRLWLSLFVDMPDDYRDKHFDEPLLPSLGFKVRRGDSLVQRIGSKTFPVHGHAHLSKGIKTKITKLKNKKQDYFFNREGADGNALLRQEYHVFSEILDVEIAEKRKDLEGVVAPQMKQTDLLSDSPTEEQALLQLSKEERKKLEGEIADLKAQKNSLSEERPFIWSIEFAEIFFDKGGFDIIIGNPPYVRQEGIADPNGILDAKKYKAALQEMVHIDFHGYFRSFKPKNPTARVNGRSDLFTYFYIRSLRLLNEAGTHVFICSNSWLDVGYGAWLQEFLLHKVPMSFVIDNHARRSFSEADVNTVITVFDAPLKEGKKTKKQVKFVAYKQPFEDMVFTENLLEIEQATALTQTEGLRVLPRSVDELLQEGSEYSDKASQNAKLSYVGDKWGAKFLRAPDIFLTIFDKCDGKFIRLQKVSNRIRRGVTTGANPFFFLTVLGDGSRQGFKRVKNSAGWEGEIEEEFIHPAVKNARDCNGLRVDPADLKLALFLCNKSKAALAGTKALEYIEWGEGETIEITRGKEKGKTVTGYHRLKSNASRPVWYDLGDRKTVKLHFGYQIHDVGKTYVSDAFFSDNFQDIDLEVEYAISINSIIFHLFQNVLGRTNFGGGLMKIQTGELEQMFIPDVKNSTSLDVLDDVGKKSIFDECGVDPDAPIPIWDQKLKLSPARKRLDDIVFEALKLTEGEREEIYKVTLTLVHERLSKAAS